MVRRAVTNAGSSGSAQRHAITQPGPTVPAESLAISPSGARIHIIAFGRNDALTFLAPGAFQPNAGRAAKGAL
jgi:hypothetical protein